MKMKLPPFEVWYFAVIITLAIVFCGCATETRDLDLGGHGVVKAWVISNGGTPKVYVPAG